MTTTTPDVQGLNFTHMYSFTDLRGKTPTVCVKKGTLYDFINSSSNYSKFKKIIEKAGMIGQLNDEEANFTMLIPTDDKIPDNFINQLDIGLAKQIFKASTLNNKISGKLLKSSPVSYFSTLNTQMRLYVTNINEKTILNNCVEVVKFDTILKNGIIHIISGLIIPSYDHFMN
jgi:hypothetical protein